MLEVKREPFSDALPHKKTTYKETSESLNHVRNPITALKAKHKYSK